jgi:gas vesicle protein
MASDYDYESGGGGGGFMMGLLTGTVLGAGLGMLFAPKSGTELRGQISDSASSASRKASEQYKKASDAAHHLTEKGRGLYDRARDAVSRGTDEARREAERMTGGGSSPSMGSASPTTNPNRGDTF